MSYEPIMTITQGTEFAILEDVRVGIASSSKTSRVSKGKAMLAPVAVWSRSSAVRFPIKT